MSLARMCGAAALWTALMPHAGAQITLDGTLGTAGALGGPNFSIGANLGQQLGGNLFHSFSQFNVLTGQSATFSGPASVSNIISRVTGDSASTINGLLRSTISGANLFLINPRGVMFGPSASINVSGSFHVSTANYLTLGTSGRFDASNPAASVLSVAPPSAFGFLGPTPAPIALNGSLLAVSTGKTLSLVGGDIGLSDARLSASAGRVNLAATASAGEVTLGAAGIDTSAGQLGNITAANAVVIVNSVPGQAAGAIYIRGGSLVLRNTFILSDNSGPGTGRGIHASVAGEMSAQGGVIGSGAFGNGNAGDVEIRTGTLAMTGGARIDTSNFGAGRGGRLSVVASGPVGISGLSRLMADASGTGPAGSVVVSAPSLTLDNGRILTQTSASAGAGGDAGGITLNVGTLSMRNFALISADTLGAARGGDVTVNASQAISFASGDLSSSSRGSGDAGNVLVSAPLLEMNGGFIFSEARSTGDAGNVGIHVGRLALSGGAFIDTETFHAGSGGSLTVAATESIGISGRSGLSSAAHGLGDAGSIFVSAPVLEMNGGSIDSESNGAGNAGTIIAELGRLSMAGGASIGASTYGPGHGGDVSVSASQAIAITGTGQPGVFDSGLASATFGSGSGGSIFVATPLLVMNGGHIASTSTENGVAGGVDVQAGSVNLSNYAFIDASSLGSGPGGNVSVSASESILISGSGLKLADPLNDGRPILLDTAIQSAAFGTGRAGSVTVSAPLVIMNGGLIRSSSEGSGNAGDIAIRAADTLRMHGGAAITTQALSEAGGNISINAGSLIYLRDSTITTSVGTGQGNGGNISIDPTFVVLDNSQIIANAHGGNGGNITIVSDFFLQSPGSLVQASSAFGLQGSVTVTAPNVNLGAGLVALPGSFFDAASQMRASCSARAARGSNSFTGAARGGLPAGPEHFGFGAYAEGAAGASAVAGGEGMAATTVQLACLH